MLFAACQNNAADKSKQTAQDSLQSAKGLDPDSLRFRQTKNYYIVTAVLTDSAHAQPGQPIKVMLEHASDGAKQVMETTNPLKVGDTLYHGKNAKGDYTLCFPCKH